MTRDVVSLPPDASVADAIDCFVLQGFAHLPVVVEDHLVGILSDRDALRLVARGEVARETAIARIMKPPLAVDRNTPIKASVDLMRSQNVHCVPVIEGDGRLCGIVTTSDLLGHLSSLLDGVSG